MPPQTLVHGQPTRPGHVFSLKRGRQAFQTPPGHENAPFRGWLTGSLYTRRAFRVRNAVRRAVRTPEGLYVYGTESVSPPQKLGSRPGGPRRLQARAVREERCDDREAPSEAKRRRHAPGGSCEAAGLEERRRECGAISTKQKIRPERRNFCFVEIRRFELLTPCLQSRCSTN